MGPLTKSKLCGSIPNRTVTVGLCDASRWQLIKEFCHSVVVPDSTKCIQCCVLPSKLRYETKVSPTALWHIELILCAVKFFMHVALYSNMHNRLRNFISGDWILFLSRKFHIHKITWPATCPACWDTDCTGHKSLMWSVTGYSGQWIVQVWKQLFWKIYFKSLFLLILNCLTFCLLYILLKWFY